MHENYPTSLGNDFMSLHEVTKGYTRPIDANKFLLPVPDELRSAHEELLAKRKLAKLLRSKAVKDLPVKVGDLIQVFIKQDKERLE